MVILGYRGKVVEVVTTRLGKRYHAHVSSITRITPIVSDR